MYTEISIRAEPGISNVYDDKIFIRVSTRACDRKKSDASFSNPLVCYTLQTRGIELGKGMRKGVRRGYRNSSDEKVERIFLSRCTSSLRREESRISSRRRETNVICFLSPFSFVLPPNSKKKRNLPNRRRTPPSSFPDRRISSLRFLI